MRDTDDGQVESGGGVTGDGCEGGEVDESGGGGSGDNSADDGGGDGGDGGDGGEDGGKATKKSKTFAEVQKKARDVRSTKSMWPQTQGVTSAGSETDGCFYAVVLYCILNVSYMSK